MTRRLIAAATLAATLGGPVLIAAPAHAGHEHENLVCVGGDSTKHPGYGTMACIEDPTRG